MTRLRRASASPREDRTRALVAAGFAVPGILTLVTLPAMRALVPPDMDPSGDAGQRLFMLFFGLASTPFTLTAAAVACLRPPNARALQIVAWTAVATAALGAAYAFSAR